MAITKNHTIDTTLKKAVAYITDPDKTDGTLLISSFACTPETADIEFEWTRQYAIDKGVHLARHMIQSFSPGETTPEQAHEIGKRLADEMLGGKYEYVLSTHTDKGHIHNHIIFNDVSFADYKHAHVNKRWYYNTRRISDRLCLEYGLSVIEPSKNKGKSYSKYTADKNGLSWKAQLRLAIDRAVRRAIDFDDFLLRMELAGYTVKRQEKNISFCNGERKKFMRSKTLGENYTVEALKKRIARQRSGPRTERKGISLLIDIENSIKAQHSRGYEYWAKLNNLKQASKTINYLTERKINSYEELTQKTAEVQGRFDDTAAKLKEVERLISEKNILAKHLRTYKALKSVYAEYRQSKNKQEFERIHRRELTLYRAAHKYLSEHQTDGKLPTLDTVTAELAELTERKGELYEKYNLCKDVPRLYRRRVPFQHFSGSYNLPLKP